MRSQIFVQGLLEERAEEREYGGRRALSTPAFVECDRFVTAVEQT